MGIGSFSQTFSELVGLGVLGIVEISTVVTLVCGLLNNLVYNQSQRYRKAGRGKQQITDWSASVDTQLRILNNYSAYLNRKVSLLPVRSLEYWTGLLRLRYQSRCLKALVVSNNTGGLRAILSTCRMCLKLF